MELLKLKRHNQITIPQSLCKKLNITVGDYVEIDVQDSQIILRPVKMIHPDQEYFYTKEWQKGESEADRDIAKGDMLGPFDTADECVKALENEKI